MPNTPSTIREQEFPDFGIFAPGNAKASACQYYRVEVPLRALEGQRKALHFIDDGISLAKETRHSMMCSADIVLFFARGGEATDAFINTVRTMKPGMDSESKKMIYPPSVVFDIDDNVDWVHPFNHVYCQLGTRAYDGTLLAPAPPDQPSTELVTTFPDGKQVTVWKDGVTEVDGCVFNIAENLKRVRGVHRSAQLCDGITVPSPYLAQYYRDVHKCHDVYVFPNSVVLKDYPTAKLAPHEGVRILWQGGGSHMVDWFPLRDAVREVSLKYPQVKWVIWGAQFKWIFDNIPEEQLELRDWVDYNAYRAHRTLMDADINLCPLVDNEFNRSKSCIKWYEGSLLAMPEATLAANCRPYSEEMVDGETGLLYNDPRDFVTKISGLIENAELRKTLGENAKKWVVQNRHVDVTVPGLFEFYEYLREKKRMVCEA